MLSLTGVERSYASALHQTMQTLTVRAEVGAVMEGMLGDLEAWEWANQEEALKKELEFERAQVAALRASETALLEREALAAAKLEEDQSIARDVRGRFVQELWGLAREFRVREQEQARADQMSKKLVRLEGVEAELREAERKLVKMQSIQDEMAATSAASSATASTPSAATITNGDGRSNAPSPRTRSPDSKGSGDDRLGSNSTGQGPELSPEVEVTTAGGGDPRTATGNETAVLTRSSLLLDLEKKPLLKVFVFLNAGEVLRAAQVCRPMFRKVDLMFGIGSQAAAAQAPRAPEGGSLDRKSNAPGGAVAAGAAGAGAAGPGAAASARSRTDSLNSTSSASAAAAGGRLGQRAASALGGVLSRVEAVTAGASGGFGTLTGFAGGAGGADGMGGPGGVSSTMTPEFVDGLSKRLSTGEMKGIIQITERGRRLEAKAGALQAEKEDLCARLQGTESVKEFLVAKLKDTEAALKRSLDEKGLTLRQSASDQEVISFLDSRTQEMEKVARETMDKAVTYQNELENQKVSGQKQTKVLEDMLRFEKQRGEAEESAFKAQKKLLVTEVKKLRTTNLGLKAECDDLRQQLKDLRKSVSQLGR